MDAPCKGCIDRRVGCHAGCERYRAFRAPLDKAIEEREKAKQIDDLAYERKYAALKKEQKFRRWMRRRRR